MSFRPKEHDRHDEYYSSDEKSNFNSTQGDIPSSFALGYCISGFQPDLAVNFSNPFDESNGKE